MCQIKSNVAALSIKELADEKSSLAAYDGADRKSVV